MSCRFPKSSPEAAGIQPLVAHSPLMSWMYVVLSLQGVSNVFSDVGPLDQVFSPAVKAWCSSCSSCNAYTSILSSMTSLQKNRFGRE
jgi:Protein of unknown function, DUF417